MQINAVLFMSGSFLFIEFTVTPNSAEPTERKIGVSCIEFLMQSEASFVSKGTFDSHFFLLIIA